MIASGLLPASRRPNPCPRSSKPFLDMSHLPAGARRLQLAPNCAATQETRSSRALFPKNTISRSVPFPAPIARFNAPDQWSRARRCWARVDHDVYFKLEPAEISSSMTQPWHCPRFRSQANESAASNSPSKNASRTSSHSEQGPAALALDSGIMTMHRLAQRHRQLAPGLMITCLSCSGESSIK